MPVRSNSVDSSEIEVDKNKVAEVLQCSSNGKQDTVCELQAGNKGPELFWELFLFSCIFRYFPWYLQHFGAQTVHLGWYFVTRVHLRFAEVCFKAV